jgi:hypothetical protein
MKTNKAFRSYEPDQLLLLPPVMAEWLTEDHLVYFVCEVVVRELGLSGIFWRYDGVQGGFPTYHPQIIAGVFFCMHTVWRRQVHGS